MIERPPSITGVAGLWSEIQRYQAGIRAVGTQKVENMTAGMNVSGCSPWMTAGLIVITAAA
jgi:hypothetical protein